MSFFPSGSNVCTPSSGNRVFKIAFNAEDTSWLDPQSAMGFSIVKARALQTIGGYEHGLLLVPSLEEHD